MRVTNYISLLIFSLFFTTIFSHKTMAQSFVGTLAQVKGDVKVLREPVLNDQSQRVIYEGREYVYTPAKIGLKVRPRQVIMAGVDGQARLIYNNGDHFVIGAGTAMVLPDKASTGDNKTPNAPTLNLLYGKIRGMVSKTGPRNNMNLKTQSAVAGVRGTDFYFTHDHVAGTQLTVLRGEVTLANLEAPKESKVVVKSGFSAKVTAPPSKGETTTAPAKVAPPKMATKEELLEIQKMSELKPDPIQLEDLNPEVKKELETLQEKSKEAVIADIKVTTPQLLPKIREKKIDSVEDVNSLVLSQLYESAPQAKPSRSKPSFKEIDKNGDDVYKKYFKTEED